MYICIYAYRCAYMYGGVDVHTHMCMYAYTSNQMHISSNSMFFWKNFLGTARSVPLACEDLRGKDYALFMCTQSTVPCIG